MSNKAWLRDEDRELIESFISDGFGNKEIAQRTGFHRNTVSRVRCATTKSKRGPRRSHSVPTPLPRCGYEWRVAVCQLNAGHRGSHSSIRYASEDAMNTRTPITLRREDVSPKSVLPFGEGR